MSRRKIAPKRKILPDPKYNNLKVAKFMNQVMTNGKKSLAESIVYGAFKEIESKSDKKPVEVFEKDCLIRLGTCVAPVGPQQKDSIVLEYNIHSDNEVLSGQLISGEMKLLKIPPLLITDRN